MPNQDIHGALDTLTLASGDISTEALIDRARQVLQTLVSIIPGRPW